MVMLDLPRYLAIYPKFSGSIQFYYTDIVTLLQKHPRQSIQILFISLFCCMLLCAHFQDKSVLSSQEMNTLEVSDPKVCIIIDFRENGAFASQDLPFPSTALRLTPKEWLASQLNRHRKAFEWIKESQNAIEGLLLMNVERHSKICFY